MFQRQVVVGDIQCGINEFSDADVAFLEVIVTGKLQHIGNNTCRAFTSVLNMVKELINASSC